MHPPPSLAPHHLYAIARNNRCISRAPFRDGVWSPSLLPSPVAPWSFLASYSSVNKESGSHACRTERLAAARVIAITCAAGVKPPGQTCRLQVEHPARGGSLAQNPDRLQRHRCTLSTREHDIPDLRRAALPCAICQTWRARLIGVLQPKWHMNSVTVATTGACTTGAATHGNDSNRVRQSCYLGATN